MSAAIPTQRRRDAGSDTWPRVRLGEVCEVVYGERIRKIDATATTYPVYGGGGETFRWATFNRENACVVSRFAMSKECVRYVKGRFFLNDSGLTVASISKFLSQEFIDWFLLGSQTKIYACGQGVAQRNLEIKRFRNLSVPLPPLAIQRRIAAKLDRLCDIVAKRKNQLSQLNQLVKSRFVEMFGDVLSYTKQFETVKVANVADVGSSKRIFQNEYVSQGIPFYRTKEIVELSHGKPITTELYISHERYAEIKERYGAPKKGDLLISAVGTIGEIWIVDGKDEFYFKDGNLMQIRPGEQLDSIYLRQCLIVLIRHFKRMIPSGTAYAALTIDSVKKMVIPLPPLALQREFAAFVEKVDKLAAAVKRGLEAAERLYRQQMQELFGETATKTTKTTETTKTTKTANAGGFSLSGLSTPSQGLNSPVGHCVKGGNANG